MAEAIGQILTLGVGVALSPIPIIAVVLMLATPRGTPGAPMKLPPPDPYESFGRPPDEDVPMLSQAVVHLMGTPSEEGDRLSAVVLAWRPGALIVVAPK